MYIQEARVSHYAGWAGPVSWQPGLRAVLLGPNGGGKSSLLRALDLVLNPFRDAYRDRLRVHDFHALDTGTPIQIEVILGGPSEDDAAYFEPYLEGRRPNGMFGNFESPREEFDESVVVLRLCLRAKFGMPARAVYLRPDANQAVVQQADKLRIGWHYVDAAIDPTHELAFYQNSVLSRLFERSDLSTQLEAIRLAIEQAKGPLLEEPTVSATRANLQDAARRLGVAAGNESIDFAVLSMSDRRVLQSLQLVLRGTRSQEHLPLLAHGRGVMRVLMLAAIVQYAQLRNENLILAVEEPEQNLEPTNQRLAARSLLFSGAGAQQVLLSTHSPAVAGILPLAELHLVRDFDSGPDVRPLRRAATPEQKFFERHAQGHLVAGLYAQTVLLVEGPTERAALPVLWAKANPVDGLDERRIEVIDTDGLPSMSSYVRFFRALGVPVVVLTDNDADTTAVEAVQVQRPTRAIRWRTHKDWEGVLAAEADPVEIARALDACIESVGATQFVPPIRDAMRKAAGDSPGLARAQRIADMIPLYSLAEQRRAIAALLRGQGGFDYKSALYARLIAESLSTVPASVVSLIALVHEVASGARPDDVRDL